MTVAADRGLPAVDRATHEARRAEQLEDHIRRLVDAAPPLTTAQRDKLALLLRAESGPDHQPGAPTPGGRE